MTRQFFTTNSCFKISGRQKRAAIISRGWLGDSIACTAAATSLSKQGYSVDFFTRWPQLEPILKNDPRYKTIVYGKYLSYKVPRPLIPQLYDLVVKEPNGWSYEEPFTSQIRRIANCDPSAEYELFLSEAQLNSVEQNPRSICIPRDIHKRAYGRDIEDLITRLSAIAEVIWVGLDPHLSSKHGKTISLATEAAKIEKSAIFLGPESGLLWLAAGLGKTSYYFTEHIEAMSERINRGNPRICLGSANHFNNQQHQALKPYCSNEEVAKTIQAYFSSIKVQSL